MFVGAVAHAQLKLDRFFPAAVAAGGESNIKAEGKFPKWPVTIVCDRADVQVSAAEASGELKVRVDQQASPGVAWIRLHDEGSASQLVPLLVEPSTISIEAEPNNKISEAISVSSPAVVSGRLEKSGDLDTYRIRANAGQTLIVSLVANRVLRAPMDAVLQLVDGAGNVLLQTDDDIGIDPQLVFSTTTDGDRFIRVFAFPETPNSTIGYAGDASFVYVMRITTDGMLDHVLPLMTGSETAESRPEGWNLSDKIGVHRAPATGISPATLHVPQSLGWQWQRAVPSGPESILESEEEGVISRADRLPLIFSGHLRQPGEIDRVRFTVSSGAKYRIAVESKRIGFQVDSVIRLVKPEDGAELAKNDDRGRDDYDAGLEYTAKEDGEIELQISDLVDGFGPRHAYSVVVEPIAPAVELDVSADAFLVKSGAEVEIPVSVRRLGGFDQRLEVLAQGLPPGVTAEAVYSEAKGDTAKSVKVKLVASADAKYQGTFRIVAHGLDAEEKRSGELAIATFELREPIRLSDLWLTVANETKK